MTKIKLEQSMNSRKRMDIINYLKYEKNIDFNKVKKILIMGAIVIVVTVGTAMVFKYVAGVNIIQYLSSFIIHERIIEGADFSKEIVKEGASFLLKK